MNAVARMRRVSVDGMDNDDDEESIIDDRFEPLVKLSGHTSWITSIVADTDRDVAYSGSFDTCVRMWDLHRLSDDVDRDNDAKVNLLINSICYNRSHSALIVTGFHGDVGLYDTRTL